MRRIPWLAVLALALGCGGGKETPTGPGTQTTSPTATTLTIQAGDNQSGAAGSTLPIKPAVLVRDQAGKAMAGVAVTFTVESGGGSIASASATTGSNGVAESGAWTVGLGENRLRANVGSLTPVRFTATGTGGTPVVIDATVGATGGTFVLNRPGDPLNGLTLTIPSPGFGKGVQVQVRTTTSASTPSKPGVRIASPVLAVETDAVGPAKAGVSFKVPATINSGEWPVAWVFDPATGKSYSAMVAPTGSGTVTVVLPQLDQTGLDVSGAGGLMGSLMLHAIPNSSIINIVIGAAPLSEIAKDQDSGYLPATDDWDFDYALSTIPAYKRFAPGLAQSAAWYYDHFKNARGALNRNFQEAPGVEWSNPRGMVLAALTGNEVAQYIEGVENYHNTLGQLAANAGLTYDSLQVLAIKSGLYLTGRPQLLYASNIANNVIGLDGVSFLVYRTRGGTLDISAGTSVAGANGPRSIATVAGKFPAVTWSYKSPILLSYDPPTTVADFVYFGPTSGVPAAKLNSLWQQVFDRSILNGLPGFDLITHESRTGKDTLFIPGDTTRVWWESPCASGYTPGPEITPLKPVGGVSLFEKKATGWTAAGGNPGDPFGANVFGHGVRASATKDDGRHFGTVLMCAGPSGASGTGSYAGWAEFTVKNRQVTVAPNPVDGVWGTQYTLTASSAYATPPQPTWEWTLGDGRMVTTTTNTLDVTYTRPNGVTTANYTASVSLKSGTTPFAGGPFVVKMQPQRRAWRLTAFVKTSDVALNPAVTTNPAWLGAWNQFTALLDRVATTPSDGMVFQEDNVAFTEHALYFEVAAAGTGAGNTYHVSGNFFSLLARAPAICSYCIYTETGGGPSNGTLVGVAGVTQTQFPIAGMGPLQLVNSVDASKVGNQLIGTVTFKTGPDGGRTYSFTAIYVGTP